MKNKIVITTTENGKKERIVLFNFSKVDHYFEKLDSKFYLRVLCDSKYYYFRSNLSVISEIEVF